MNIHRNNTPKTEEHLWLRAESLAGMFVSEIARIAQKTVPTDTTHAKGWIGQLVERILGATAGSAAIPDFPHLGIEVKTVPVDEDGVPLETTYVCMAPLMLNETMQWDKSVVKNKIQHVLWIPYQGSDSIPISEKIIGYPILWRLDHKTELILKQDFEELVEWIVNGKVEYIRADMGVYLHIRPKAARGDVRREGIGEEGQTIKTLPRGFYLRTHFTKELFKQYFF